MLDIWQFFSSYNFPTVVFCHFLFSSFRVVAAWLGTSVFLNTILSTRAQSLSVLRSIRVKSMKSSRALMAVCSLHRASCRQQRSAMPVSTSHDTKSRALVGSFLWKWIFVVHDCHIAHTGINVCVHFVGLQWENMYSSPVQDDTTSFGWLCGLIVADSFIYFMIAWYVRNVFPGMNILPTHACFLWLSLLWVG